MTCADDEEFENHVHLVFLRDIAGSRDDPAQTLEEISEAIASMNVNDTNPWGRGAKFSCTSGSPREPHESEYCVGLAVTVRATVPGNQDEELSWGIYHELHRETLRQYVIEEVGRVLLAACIARPGSFAVVDALTDTRPETISVDCLKARVPAKCLQLARDFKWPPLTTLPLRDVLVWMETIGGARSGWGTGPIGRALAALTFAVSQPSQLHANVLWPLVGLESLYGREREGLQRQLLDKSEVLLGPRTEFKKRFARIYQARSELIHGSMDFPFAYRQAHSAARDKHDSELEEIAQLSLAMLVATVQRLVSEGATELEFVYTRGEPKADQ